MNWWYELTGLQRLFTSIAVPATLVMIIQFILLLLGLSHGDGSDVDANVDTHVDLQIHDHFEGDSHDVDVHDLSGHQPGEAHDNVDAMRLFTLRSIIAFLSVGGWMGVVAIDWRLPIPLVFILAFVAGWIALYFVAWSIRMALRLQQSGNIVAENAVGNIGEVYIPIPAAKAGAGKVNVLVQDRLSEFDAVTEADRELSTGEEVTVTGISADGVLLVIPKNNPPEGVIIEKNF